MRGDPTVEGAPLGWRSMWILVMFDLPTKTTPQKRDYVSFRKKLLQNGFTMFQYSVYGRHCTSMEKATAHENRIKLALPPAGQVRTLVITDAQFSRIKVFQGRARKREEKPTPQLLLL